MRIVFTSTNNKKEAKNLSKLLLENKFCACVQRLKIKSAYVWKGKICKEDEYLLLCKTKKYKLKDLKEFLKAHHSYEVPEFFSLKAKYTDKDYLLWLKDFLK